MCPVLISQDRADQEIVYPSKDFAKLDTFESLNLEDADKLFAKRDHKGLLQPTKRIRLNSPRAQRYLMFY